MATTFKQRRRRDIIIGIVAAALLLSFGLRKQILPIFLGPVGFAKHAPAGQFAPLDWSVMKQAEKGKDRFQVPQAVSSLDGMPVSIHGYTFPVISERETEKLIVVEKGIKVTDGDEIESPQLNEAVLVLSAKEKKLQIFPRPKKVGVYGILLLTTDGKSGPLYTIKDAEVVLER